MAALLEEPKKPASAYWIWLNASRPQLAAEAGSSKPTILAKFAGQKWKAMSEAERAPLEKKAAELKEAYVKALADFKAQGGEVGKRRQEKVSDVSESGGTASTELSSEASPRGCAPEGLAEENAALKREVLRLRAQLQQKEELETRQELQEDGPEAAAAKGPNRKEMRKLLQFIEEFFRATKALPMGLSPREAAEARRALRGRAAPMLRRNKFSDEASVRRMRDELKPQRALESLQSLRQTKPPNGDTESGIGKVIGKMTEDVGAIIDKFGGDGPVPYSTEDRMIRRLIKTSIVAVIEELENVEKGAALLGKDLDEQEERMISEIMEKSKDLVGTSPQRGKKEQERNLQVKELLEYHVERVRIANSQNKPMEILQVKLKEFELEAEGDSEAYKIMQEDHLNYASALREQKQQFDELVCEAEEDSRQEERREYLKVEVEALGESLGRVLEKVQHLSEECALLDGKELACEEAKKVRTEELPGLEDAMEAHVETHGRLVRGGELLADVATCFKAAYSGLMEHSKNYVAECERMAPVYGAKCMAVQQNLHATIDAQKEKLEKYLEVQTQTLEELEDALRMAEMDSDGTDFPEAARKFEECERKCEVFEEQLRDLELVKSGTSPEVLQPAQEAAALADPAMQECAQKWVKQFLFEPEKKCKRAPLPAVTAGEKVPLSGRGARQVEDRRDASPQLQDGQALGGRASAVDEDAVSVESNFEYVVVGDASGGPAKSPGGTMDQPSTESCAGEVAAPVATSGEGPSAGLCLAAVEEVEPQAGEAPVGFAQNEGIEEEMTTGEEV